MTLSRRSILKSSALAATAVGMRTAKSYAAEAGANESVRVAVIGTGGRGGAHIGGFSDAKGARIVALCDADETAVNKKAESLEKKTGGDIRRVIDYREILDNKDIDAVTIAAPNHWHALMTIEACQAGKHVYTEKPVCHHIWEGRQMVNAMKKYDRIVAAGFQNRSDVGLLEAIPMIHDGKYGDITMARGLCYRKRASIGKRDTPLTPPEGVNYDLWLGPAADIPIMRPRFHYDWHWVFNTGNGDMGNQGPHEMDLLRWALGDPKHPNKVMSFGGRFGWDDAGNTPNMQCAMFDFGNDIPVIFEVRNLHQKGNDKGAYRNGPGVGIHITCEKGEFRGGRGGGAFYDNDGKKVESFKGDSGRTHMQNFVDAVRSNDASMLRSPIESAFYSSCMSHLANISVLSGKDVDGDRLQNNLLGNALASEAYARFAEQLAEWKVDTTKTPWQQGSWLTFDGESEQFTEGENVSAANALVRRDCRKPYIVPEIS